MCSRLALVASSALLLCGPAVRDASAFVAGPAPASRQMHSQGVASSSMRSSSSRQQRSSCHRRSTERALDTRRQAVLDVGFDNEEGDQEAMQEAERIMEQLQADAERENVIPEGVAKYMPTTEDSDPIVAALKTVLKCTEVKGLELLDSRWNGNEAFRYDTDKGRFFVKMNRVEDVSVLMTEAVSLSALAKTQTLHCPLPLHLGRLPKVGDIGPGAFMVLEWLDLKPFGAMRSDVQSGLGDKLADLHLSRVHDDLHKGRFGFPVSNFLALTPLNNEWCDTWTELFTRRMNDQLRTLYQDKAYGRAALAKGKDGGLKEALGAVIEGIPAMLEGVEVTPVLLHGDMWIGNAGGTPEGPCCFDPASFFGHSEFDLSIMDLFAGYTDAFWAAYHAKIPRAEGFRERQRVYQLYHYLNQLNLFGDSNVALTVQRLTADILEAQQASRQPVGSSA